jgi:hypothetical protein
MAEDTKTRQLKILIARTALIVGVKAKKAKGEELARLGVVIGLLNQANLISNTSGTEARKILTLARSMKSGSDNKDEKRKSRPKRNSGRVDEKRKKDTTR